MTTPLSNERLSQNTMSQSEVDERLEKVKADMALQDRKAWAYFLPLSDAGCNNWSDEVQEAFKAGFRCALRVDQAVECGNCRQLLPTDEGVPCKYCEDDANA